MRCRGGLINPCSAGRTFLEILCCLHLSQFRGIPVPSGDFSAPTCHTLAAFPCQVAVSLLPPVTVSPPFPCPVAALLLPPVTVSPPFRARWQLRCLHLSHSCGLPVPGGVSAASTWRTFAAFPCQVATFRPPPVTLLRPSRGRWRLCCFHLSHFRCIPVPGGIPAVSVPQRGEP